MKKQTNVEISTSEILVVDDKIENLDIMRHFLEDEGFSVSVVTSGEAALERIKRASPNLILLDIMMTGIDGLQTCRQLKAPNSPAKDIPVIFVTAKTSALDIVKGFELGAVDYITKPYKKEEVCARVRTHLQNQALIKMLDEQQEQFRVIVNNIAEALLIIDNDGLISFINPKAKSLFGYDIHSDELIGQQIELLLAAPFDTEYREYFSATSENRMQVRKIPYGQREILGKRKDGLKFNMNLSITEFLDESRYLGLCYDVSLKRRSEQGEIHIARQDFYESEIKQLLRILQTDTLTNIYNRRHFDDVLHEEWKRAIRTETPITLIFMDVDYFKLYNDTYGHSAGDRCLQKVAQKLKCTLKRATDLAARYGGEEFVALLPGTTEDEALGMANNIRANIEALGIKHSQSAVVENVTVSIGVAVVRPTQLSKSSDLIESADKAMYLAKAAGRNQVKLAILK